MVNQCIERTDRMEKLITKNEEANNDKFVVIDARQTVVERKQEVYDQKLHEIDAKLELLSSNNQRPSDQQNTRASPNSKTSMDWIIPKQHFF